MNGKIIGIGLIVSSIIFAAGLWYFTEYAHYKPLDASSETAQISVLTFDGEPQNLTVNEVTGLDGISSPLKFRACFTTTTSVAMMTETYQLYAERPTPLNAPRQLPCFDAAQIGEDLENEVAFAFLSEPNFLYGFDRVIAIYPDGRGYAWNQLNKCGYADSKGQPLPRDCPLPPEGQ